MKPLNLVGHTVNIGNNKQTYALELICFFYPDYRIMQEGDYYPYNEKLIFVEGRSVKSTLQWIGNSGKSVIYAMSTLDKFDFDFTDYNQILRFVYAKWGLDAEYFLGEDIENISRLDMFDFLNFIKPRWISKDLCLYDGTDTFINIHSIIGKGFNEILYLCDSITVENVVRLEMGLINFIETARNRKRYDSKMYSKYNELYRRFNSTFDNTYIALSLARYRNMENCKKFKLIWLLSRFSFEGVGDNI